MKRGLDFDKAEAALKRAAEKATHGTREERSGRFLPGGRLDPKGTILVERVRDSKAGVADKWRKR
jgi:hypothetical protein